MLILKCKMCGGNLKITDNDTVCTCEYCGTTQTIPKLDDEKKNKLYERANRLRFNNEFDKAYSVYQEIINDFPEEAEAYWGLLLCKYGIEYVEDPYTHKRIPTCHRSSFDSIFDDKDFEMVMENADITSRSVYREEAKTIEEIRKGIIEVSSKEEPYDIFICYKETDENNNRTVDSVIAQDVYNALTEKGYRVFFSRISLEDKLGQEYEPYIFAALNSAKIMLVFGTKYDYFNAVWVKNEWSRFLQLIAKGENKTLIPCYRDIDIYDMPKEFIHLQSQDMAKVGAVQDLLRGIGKIIPKKDLRQFTKIDSNSESNLSVDSLIKRIQISLDNDDFKQADIYCERILDAEPENGMAYFYKLLFDLKLHKLEDFENFEKSFKDNANFLNVKRFLNDHEIVDYLDRIEGRNEERFKENTYNSILNDMKTAKTVSDYQNIVGELNKIKGYKDSDDLIDVCNTRIKENEVEKQNNKKKKNMILLACILLMIVSALVYIFVFVPSSKINEAKALISNNKYSEAIEILEQMKNNSKAEDLLVDCNIGLAKSNLSYYQTNSQIISSGVEQLEQIAGKNKTTDGKVEQTIIEILDTYLEKYDISRAMALGGQYSYLGEETVTSNLKSYKKLIDLLADINEDKGREYNEKFFDTKFEIRFSDDSGKTYKTSDSISNKASIKWNLYKTGTDLDSVFKEKIIRMLLEYPDGDSVELDYDYVDRGYDRDASVRWWGWDEGVGDSYFGAFRVTLFDGNEKLASQSINVY